MRSALDECDRLQRLANALMALASSDSDRIPLHRSVQNVAALLRETRGRLVRRADDAGREILVDAREDIRWNLDPTRIGSAVGNLIENSLKHGEGDVSVSADVSHGELLIAVGDGGPGLPGDFEERAFDRFARADTSRTTEGSGLGLAIVKAIAEAHGGSASIASPRDGGALVRIRIPEAEIAAVVATSKPKP